MFSTFEISLSAFRDRGLESATSFYHALRLVTLHGLAGMASPPHQSIGTPLGTSWNLCFSKGTLFRFWLKERLVLRRARSQPETSCATVFTASYGHRKRWSSLIVIQVHSVRKQRQNAIEEASFARDNFMPASTDVDICHLRCCLIKSTLPAIPPIFWPFPFEFFHDLLATVSAETFWRAS